MNKTILRLLILLGSVMLLVLAWQHSDSKPESQTQPQHQDVAIGFAPIPASLPSCDKADVDQTTEETATDDTGCIGIGLPDDFYLEEQPLNVEPSASAPATSESEHTDSAQTGLKRMLQSMFYKILQLLSKL